MKRFLAVLLVVIGCLAVLRPCSSDAVESRTKVASTRTNWVDHWVTNTTEIQVQLNRFVTEFHTNWVTQVRTNYVDLFTTNLVHRTVTNLFVLDAFQTNFVQAYQTNLKTLHLTNWTTVVAFKTNWVAKPLTNLVEIDLPSEAALPKSTAQAAPPLNEPLALQATRNPRSVNGSQIEVQLTVSWTHAPAAPVQVQQWRIEREDGSILCFGQDPEFKRALPAGTYKVMVKAQRDAKSPLLAALGTLTVTPREVLIEQRPARANSSI